MELPIGDRLMLNTIITARSGAPPARPSIIDTERSDPTGLC